jgi:hypothetical protein
MPILLLKARGLSTFKSIEWPVTKKEVWHSV